MGVELPSSDVPARDGNNGDGNHEDGSYKSVFAALMEEAKHELYPGCTQFQSSHL